MLDDFFNSEISAFRSKVMFFNSIISIYVDEEPLQHHLIVVLRIRHSATVIST